MNRVLIAPLDWGLGHATRCIPIIEGFLQRDADVILAGNGDSLQLLAKEFPALKYYELPGYNPRYSESGMMILKMIAQVPRFLNVIRQEHKVLKEIVSKERIDLVVSDNRYGCWSDKVPSIFITHQIHIPVPHHLGLKHWVNRYNFRLIEKFTECWIPDYPGHHSLAGKLMRTEKTGLSNVKFIGNLSRFKRKDLGTISHKFDVLAVLSGPEPQRTALENILIRQLANSGLRYFIVRGVIGGHKPIAESVPAADYMQTAELQSMIDQSDCVIARSGYTTIMDLARLGKRAIFIPTPGQSEQRYLGRRLMKMRIALCVDQGKFELTKALKLSKRFIGFNFTEDRFNLLDPALDETFANLLNPSKMGLKNR
ncbi:MAG: glycosyltransferase [Chryseolinea sp.]